jgi:flagellar motor switch protein FliN
MADEIVPNPASAPPPADNSPAARALKAAQEAILQARNPTSASATEPHADEIDPNDPDAAIAAQMAAGISAPSPFGTSSTPKPPPPPARPTVAAQPFEMPSFSSPPPEPLPANMEILADVNLNVKIELGRTKMLLEDVLKLGEGTVVELDKLAGDPVDIYVNDRPVARGEVLVLNDNFCVRISEILSKDAVEDRIHNT